MQRDDDDWEEIWDARIDALSEALGSDMVNGFHAPHPFALGGQADVVVFDHLGGRAYVTAELTGKPTMLYADYELMICHREHETIWGANVVSRLAPYTQQAPLLSGESMDIDEATPTDSAIKALLFDTYRTFSMFGETFDIRLCLGITKDELQFKFDHGAEALLSKLRQAGVYPFTDLSRSSVLHPA
jgi:Suppressor of fused protein (SUFU)